MRTSDMLIKKLKWIAVWLLSVLFVCSGCRRDSRIRYYAVERTLSQETSKTETLFEPVTAAAETQAESTAAEKTTALLYVYVVGCVHSPGVYTLTEGSRLYEAVEMAGGLTDEANAAALNLAEKVYDGEYVLVPAVAMEASPGQIYASGAANHPAAEPVLSGVLTADTNSTLVNINTADRSGLMTLPGIGESKAQAIITYRETNGPFTSAEDLMKVAGIKESVYEKIRDRITVQ